MKEMLIKNRKFVIIGAVVLAIIACSMVVGYAATPDLVAERAVNRLFQDNEKYLAKNIIQDKIDDAQEKTDKLSDENKKEELQAKIDVASKMLTVQTDVNSLYYQKNDGSTLVVSSIEQKNFDAIEKGLKALNEEKPDFVKAMNEKKSDAENYFKAVQKINSLYSDGAKRTTLKADASVAVFKEAQAFVDKINSEAIKAQAEEIVSSKLKKELENPKTAAPTPTPEATVNDSGSTEATDDSGETYYDDGYDDYYYDYGNYSGGSSSGGSTSDTTPAPETPPDTGGESSGGDNSGGSETETPDPAPDPGEGGEEGTV